MKPLALHYTNEFGELSPWYCNFTVVWSNDPDCWDYTEFLNSHNCEKLMNGCGFEFKTEEDLTLFLLKFS